MISPSRNNQGMALIVVLWMVAALSIVATGLLTTVKSEIRVASHHKQTVVAGALADAAIRRVLQDLAANKPAISRKIHIEAPVPGQPVSAVVQPVGDRIDINQAPEGLLVALFQYGGKQSAEVSAQLARSVVEARNRRDPQGRPAGFAAPEDLLRLPGVDYALYATIRPLVSSGHGGGGRVNPQVASPQVLSLLLKGNEALASQLVVARDSSPQPMDTTLFDPAFVDSSPTMVVQVGARVSLADGSMFVKSWSVKLVPYETTGLPWQVLDAQLHVVPYGV